MTLARRHFQRVTAAQASAEAEPGAPVDATAYELVLMQLSEHKRRLKQVQSIERKIEVKRQLLPEYDPWVEGVLQAGRGGQDAVLMTIMVWRIDTGDIAGALRIADYALRHDLAMPDQYQRDVATIVAEEVADQALKQLAAGEPADWDLLGQTEQLTAGRDMPDQVRAKLQKALGLEMLRAMEAPADDPNAPSQRADAALTFLRRALQLNERAGVKKEIERLERFLKNNPAKSTAGETGASADASTGQPGAPAPESSG